MRNSYPITQKLGSIKRDILLNAFISRNNRSIFANDKKLFVV